PPDRKRRKRETAGAKAEADKTSVAKSGGGKESRATERGMGLRESSSGARL
ncbi:MAG: hypothetical protein UR68_C0036G0001, partial [Candidatus Roizmanbacteria bacterium GW2011_GWA2_35_19]